jgi:hypothetical protein
MPPIPTISIWSIPGALILWFARMIAGAISRKPANTNKIIKINEQNIMINIFSTLFFIFFYFCTEKFRKG